MRVRSFLALVIALGGCTPSARRVAEPPGAAPVSVPTGKENGARLLRDPARAAQGSGAGPLKMIDYGAAQAGDHIEGLVHVPPETCALFLARATEGVDDLDLHIYSDDGTQYGVDESPDDLPTLLLCPKKELRLFVSARVAQGSGLVSLGVQTFEPQASAAVAKAVGARNYSETAQDIEEEAWPGLQAELDERRRFLGGKWKDRRRVALPVDARVPTALTVELPVDRCLDALFLPSDEISQLQVTAVDPQGRVVARAQPNGKHRALLLCSGDEPVKLNLRVRPYAGRGLAVAILSVSEHSTRQVTPDPDVQIHHLNSGASKSLHKLGKAARTHTFKVAGGRIRSMKTKLTGCTRIDVLPQAGLRAYSVELWDEQGRLLGSGGGSGHRSLFACARGPVRIDMEAKGPGGTAVVEERPGEDDPKEIFALPLAGSRILGIASETSQVEMPRDIGRLHRVELDDTHLTQVALSIPAAHCQTVFVAGGHGTWGLEGRLVEARTGLELDRAQGRHSITLRACAPSAGHLRARAEIRTVNGKASAFWSQRQHKLAD